MKKVITPYFLLGLLFVANPGLVLAEEIAVEETEFIQEEVSEDSIIDEFVVEDSATTTEDIDTIEISTTTEESSSEITEPEESIMSVLSLASEPDTTIDVHITLRYNDSIVFNDSVELPADSTTTISDNTDTSREIIVSSALGALHTADVSSDQFDISDLAYYSSYDSFLINCLGVALDDSEEKTNACYNWQYVVNDSYPYVGIDKYLLEDGDTLYFYFGNPRIIELSTTTMYVGSSVTATAKSYNYKDNVYNPLVDYVIGLTQPDPSNPWSPIILSATSSNVLGQAIFTIDTAGSYGIGLESDYYYPVYNVDVIATSATTTPDDSGGGGSSNNSDQEIDIEKAIEFLLSHQNKNGSFGADLYTDWAGIALSSISGNESAQNLTKNYLKSDTISGSVLTDFERRAMALMSLGVNPYSGTETNYIEKILNEFDGVQFGDEDLFNDDIFALFPLLNAGYSSDDEEISKAVAFIISQQNSNGSWESVDLTAAAIQALVLVEDVPQVKSALSKAKSYLKSEQNKDGGFGNTFATLWVLQAIAALGEDVDSWSVGDENPLTYIASTQAEDGGLESDLDINSRVWATSYLIPAYYEKTWDDVMKHFSRQEGNNSSGGSNSTEEETVATSTTVLDIEFPVVEVDEIVASTTTVFQETFTEINVPKEFAVESTTTNDGMEQENSNLQANVIGAIDESGLMSVFKAVIDTTLAGIVTVWGFAVSLFNF